jgi:predicted Zn-dependent protease
VTEAATPPLLAVEHFDGRSARPTPCRIRLEGDTLVVQHGGQATRVPRKAVQWPERHQGGARVAWLPDGGSLHAADGPAWDRWAAASGLHDSWTVRAQQSLRATLVAALVLLLLLGALYRWALPWGVERAVALVPLSVDREIGDRALAQLRDAGWLQPSKLPAARRQRLQAAWDNAWARARQPGDLPLTLHFHALRGGPNAFALPGGQVVMSDAMVELAGNGDDGDAMLVGVLAHEAGHVRHRHGLRMLAHSAVLGTVGALAFGDFSGWLAAAPALLGQMAYSRDAERESDGEAIALLHANGLSPAVMATLFERLRAERRRQGWPQPPLALASHPEDDERIERFRAAAR